MTGAVEAALRGLGERLGVTVHAVEVVGSGRTGDRDAGRRAARAALIDAGGPDVLIPWEDDGRPRWPTGWTGSIAHGAGHAVAAVTNDGRSVGLDIEATGGLAADEATLVLDPAELATARAADDPTVMTTLLWSAKESAFKAWSGALGGLPGVDPSEIHVDVDVATASLTVSATGSLAERVDALALRGCYSLDAAVTLTVLAAQRGRHR